MNLNTTRNRYIVPPTAQEAQSFEQGLFGAEPAAPSPPPATRPEPAADSVRPKKPAARPRPRSVYLSR